MTASLATMRRVGASRSELEGFATSIHTNATVLVEQMQGVRDNLPPQVEAYFSQLSTVLSTGDAYTKALGVHFGDWRDDSRNSRGMATSTYLTYCRQAKSWLDWLDDTWYIPTAWSFPDVRALISDILGSYKNLSTALWTANSEAATIFHGSVELYDTGEELRRASAGWLSASLSTMASDICSDYVTHSGYRRLKKMRKRDVHPRWDEVCDTWANDYDRAAGTWGTEFKWPREDDPGWKRMPMAMKMEADLIEEGCLPWEVCPHNITRPGLKGSLTSKLDLAPNIRGLVTGYTIDNVFDTADALALDVKQLITELIRHLNHIIGLVRGSVIPNDVEDNIIDSMNGVKGALRAYRSQLQDMRNLGTATKAYWRGSSFATSWRSDVTPYLNQAVAVSADIESTIDSGLLSTCNFIYPQGSVKRTAKADRARKIYWESAGVPAKCWAPTGGIVKPWSPPVPIAPPGQLRRPAHQFETESGDREPEGFGAIQIASKRFMGLLPWQAIALIVGAWMFWPEKK
jgi:hypothetical protein